MISQRERQTLRLLAYRWKDLACLPVMDERKRLWKAIKDLKAERPAMLVETCMLSDYISDDELQCREPYLRNIEKSLLEIVRHADEIKDDIVIDPYFRIPWIIEMTDYGVPIEIHHAVTSTGNNLGYSFNFPIKTPADFFKLKHRERHVDREATQKQKEMLEDIFGDILPIKVGGYDPFNRDPGYHPWLGNLYGGLTMDLFKLTGNNNLLYWVYDEPELIHSLMEFLRDDRLAHFRWMEKEGLLYVNTDTWNPCPGSYGNISGLPREDFNGKEVRLDDCWIWSDSQETAPVSPKMFNEFFLPYIADVCKLGGYTYYGCCEGIHDRFEYIEKMIPNLRAVSVSGWSDLFKAGELLGRKYVYSRKPVPAYISGEYPDWDLLKKDVCDTLTAAKDCSLEFCFRDIYTINGERKRLSRWVEMVRAMIGN